MNTTKWHPKAGTSLLWIGILHTLVGLTLGFGLLSDPGLSGSEGRSPLLEIVSSGVVNSVEPDLLRATFFWFMFFGFVLMMLGAVMQYFERQNQPLPKSLGWQLVGLSLLGGLMIPASGFWLAAPVGWLVLSRS